VRRPATKKSVRHSLKKLVIQKRIGTPLNRQIPSLADLLEASPENLQHLFVKGGLGKVGRADNLFFFLASQFESFQAAFMMEENCEVTQCKIKGMKTKQWFVRLGSQY
jgi:hypothetical protein